MNPEEHPEFDFSAPPKKSAAEVSADLLDKIKKLLRLSESVNQHEAALAMARAMELADRHNLDITTLDTDDEVEHIIHKWFPCGKYVGLEQRLAISIAQTYFNVTACYGFRRFVFVGKDADIMIADYVVGFLVHTVQDCLREYERSERVRRRRVTPRKRAGFRTGFFYGIADQLDSRREKILLENSKFAVVLASQEQERDKTLHELVGDTCTPKRREAKKNQGAVMT
jgi:hypothetical protein